MYASKFIVEGDHHVLDDIELATVLVPPACGATKVLIQASVQDARMTLDGTRPTESKGFLLKVGEVVQEFDFSGCTKVIVIGVAVGAKIQYQWGSDE